MPDIEVHPAEISFKNKGVCFQDTRQIYIRNAGEAELTIEGLETTGGTTPGEFTIDTADGFSLKAGEEVSIDVIYSPLDYADEQDTGAVNIYSNDRDERTSVVKLSEEPRGTWNLFWFGVFETHESPYGEGNPKIALRMETEAEYNCYNYQIIAETEVLGDSISIAINGVVLDGGCLTAFGRATHQSFMEVPEGEYLLTFNFTGLTDRYILRATESSIEVVNELSDFTRPVFNVYHRFPPNSFEYSCGTTNDTTWICDDFVDLLQDELEIQEFYFPDCGVLPAWRRYWGAEYHMFPRHFHYLTEEDFDRAGEVLRSFKQDVIKDQQGIILSLVSWRNEQYYSWMMR